MQVVRFTKFWAGLTVDELGRRAAELGYDGLDLAVRAGHAVNPDNVPEVLPDAVRRWRAQGVACPMISAPPDLIDSEAREAQRLFAAAAESGVPRIKIGYFGYRPGEDFNAVFAAARKALKGFETLSRRTGVQTMYHTHSGLCLGSNCAGLRHLLEGFDPALVGAYPDLGHLAANGEDVLMALPMVRERLAAIGAKDAHHVRAARPDARAAYTHAFVFVGEGAAQWRDALRLLHAWRFDGPITVHTEYTADPDVISTVGGADESPEAAALRATGEAADLAYLRATWKQLTAG